MSRSTEPVPAAASPGLSSGPARATLGTFIIIIGLGALAAVTFFHPSASRIHTWPMSAVVAAVWLLPVVILLMELVRTPGWCAPPALVSIGLLVLLIATGVSAAGSPFAPASLPRIWPTFGGVSLYLLLHHACAGETGMTAARVGWTARILGFGGVLLSFVSLLEWSRGTWPLPWGTRNTAPFGHSIYTAGAAVFVFPWIILQVLRTRGALRVVGVLGATATIAVIISTSSRGGVLALAATAAVASIPVLMRSRWTPRQKGLLVLGMAGVGLVVVFTNPRLRELVLHQRWPEVARESNEQRRAMFEAGLELGRARPLLGWGPGTVPLAYPRVRAALDGGTENILQLHNTPAQIFATTGAPGVLALLFLLAGGMASALRPHRNPVAYTAAASLVGYGLFSLTDHQLDVPAFTAMAAASFALLTASGVPGPGLRPRTIRFGFGILVATGGVVAARSTFLDLRARQLYDHALTELGNNRPEAYLRLLDQATATTPHDPFFAHQAAAWLLEQRHATRDAARQHSLAHEAAQRLVQSLDTGAHQEYAQFNLGWLLLDLNQPADAARHFIAAAHLVPDKGGVYFGLGLSCLAANHRESAVRAFALEWINDPRQLTSPTWELPALAQLVPEIRQEVMKLYDQLRPTLPPAAIIANWTRWWWGETVPPAALAPGFNATSAHFAATLAAISRREPITASSESWARAYAVWREAAQRNEAAGPGLFLSLAASDREYAAALARRAGRQPNDFRAFLASPVGDEPSLLLTLRRQRIGYGVLALHPEGPPIADLFVVQENRVITDFAAGLFPAKGWIPGRFLLPLLPKIR